MSQASEDLLAELQEVARVMYPNSDPRASLAGDEPGSVGFRIVPSAAKPRMIVRDGAGAGAGAATALATYSTALSSRQRLTRLVGSRAARSIWGTGLAGVGFSVLLGDPGGESLEEHVSAMAGVPVSLIVGIGTRRANRKPVILVTDRSGGRLFYLKVGHNAVTARLVDGEMQNLRIVERGDLGAVSAPSVLDFHTWSGMHLLAISCLPTSARDRSSGRAPLAQMQDVARGFAEASGLQERTDLLEDLDTTIAGLSGRESGTSERLSCIRQKAGEWLSDDPVRFAWHGDWTPWNMSRAAGRVQLWDWERFEVGVPFGLDAVHYYVNLRTVSRGFTTQAVQRGLAEATDALGYTGGSADELQLAYLVKMVTRYAASLAEEGGEVIRPKSDLMVDELERRLGLRSGVGGP